MPLLNDSSTANLVLHNVSQYILGSDLLTGLWIILLLFSFLTLMRVEFIIGVVLLIPINIVLMAYGYILPVAGGLLILTAGFVLAANFFSHRS